MWGNNNIRVGSGLEVTKYEGFFTKYCCVLWRRGIVVNILFLFVRFYMNCKN